MAEEQRKNEEKERKELEKIMAVREEQKRRQKEAEEAFIVMREKASGFPVPIHLAGCHVLTKRPFNLIYLIILNHKTTIF